MDIVKRTCSNCGEPVTKTGGAIAHTGGRLWCRKREATWDEMAAALYQAVLTGAADWIDVKGFAEAAYQPSFSNPRLMRTPAQAYGPRNDNWPAWFKLNQ